MATTREHEDATVPEHEKIAVIGIGCRFAPDLDSPEKYWEFLLAGRDAVREMPAERWEPFASSGPEVAAVLRRTTRYGAFLTDIEGFDAGHFGISPREAICMDPQQRILLEITWDGLERAGIPPHRLAGHDVGVFIAANSFDYGQRLFTDIPRIEPWAVNGAMLFALANRISYAFDLRGPSMTVDTACAGSLTAVHLACQSLAQHEVPLAIAGGVNIMSGPGMFVALDATGALAVDGRSRAFDQSASGYGRGEGAGIVVLKRLTDALRDGDPVLSVILGTAVFQDGRTPGMWAPNGRAQEHLMRELYRRVGVQATSVGYVEAHGTGTPNGDRVEIETLARVYGRDREPGRPCLLGSVKPNIGHLEAGAGIAGLIKTSLAIQHGVIPPSLHDELSAEIDWPSSGLEVVSTPTAWPPGGTARRGAVSSYGMGGTISHAVLDQAPAADRDVAVAPGHDSPPRLFLLSAASDGGLRKLADRVAGWLDARDEAPLGSVADTLATRRSHLGMRAAVAAGTAEELAGRLRRLAAGDASPDVVTGRDTEPGDPVWVFSGHGAQWPGMAQELLAAEPAFSAVMDALAPVFLAELGTSPRAAILDGDWSSVTRVQAMTFAIQVGLAEVWRSRGVRPGAIVGHSVGEIAAAVTAGVLDIEAAARFACRRALLLGKCSGRGGMAMVGLPFVEVEAALADSGTLAAAVASSPATTVVSGDLDELEAAMADWTAAGMMVRRVDTDVAFHSQHMDPLLTDLAAAAAELRPRPARVRCYSSVSTDPRSEAARDSDYWVANLREPVRFSAAIEAAIADGHRAFLEVSTHPIVAHSISDCLAHLSVPDGLVTPTLRRGCPEALTLLRGLAELHCHGVPVDWAGCLPHGELVELPTMAWQRRPYWPTPSPRPTGTGGGHDPQSSSLLGTRRTISAPTSISTWDTYLDFACRPYPGQHPVHGVEIVPAAVLINTLLGAASDGQRAVQLTDIALRIPVAPTPARAVQIVRHGQSLRICSRVLDQDGADDEHSWVTHTTATAAAGSERPAAEQGRFAERTDLDAVRERCQRLPWAVADERFRNVGVAGYGFDWRMDDLCLGDGELIARITAAQTGRAAAAWPELLDGALTCTPLLLPDDGTLRMPAHIDVFALRGDPPEYVTVHAWRAGHGAAGDTVDVAILDPAGRTVVTVEGLRFGDLDGVAVVAAAPRHLLYELGWRELTGPAEPADATASAAFLVGPDGARISELAGALRERGMRCTRARTPDQLPDELPDEPGVVVVVPDPAPAAGDAAEQAERNVWLLARAAQKLAAAAVRGERDGHRTPTRWRLWCLTEGVRDGQDTALGHAPLWGASRIIAGEHPEIWGGIVDIAPGVARAGERLLALVGTAGKEDVIALDAGGASAARLVPAEGAAVRDELTCRADGTYLITGGLGALGLQVARWLVDRGATRLILAGRHGLPARPDWPAVTDESTRQRIAAVHTLEGLGATVRVLALDIADAEQVAAALQAAAAELPPIRGVVHAAGVATDALLAEITPESLHAAMRAKTHGALTLHRLFPPGSVDFFVLFSSSGQFARITGQTGYAAANSFLDGLAALRRKDGHDETVSLGWMSWRGTGMAAALTAATIEANARGLDAIAPAEAFEAWRCASRMGQGYLAVLRPCAIPGGIEPPPVLTELAAVHDRSGAADEPLTRPEPTPEDVGRQVAEVLRLPLDELETRRPLTELGIDSVMTVSLRIALQRRYGIEVPPTILWNRPTIGAISGYLFERLADGG